MYVLKKKFTQNFGAILLNEKMLGRKTEAIRMFRGYKLIYNS